MQDSAKLQIVDILRRGGFDFISACELAEQALREFKASGKRSETYHAKTVSFQIRRD